MKIRILVILALLMFFVASLRGGTLIYRTKKDGDEKTLSKVKLISIDKDLVTIEQGKGKKTIPLKWMVKYYDSDIATGGEQFEDETSDYTISISKIDMPRDGVKSTKKNGRQTNKNDWCEVEYSITRTPKEGQSKSTKMPYFYLFVLTTGSNEYGSRPEFQYYYPAMAKISSKTYDEAKIMEKISSLDRPLIYWNEQNDMRTSSSGHIGERVAKFELKGVKDRKIIAYHLIIWGKKEVIAEKDWKEMTANVGDRWWKKY